MLSLHSTVLGFISKNEEYKLQNNILADKTLVKF